LSAGAVASWVVLGEYAAREDQRHAFRLGASYSSQPIAVGSTLEPVAVTDRIRTVGGIYGFDRWQLTPGVSVEYGARVDRYDYVSDAQFLSPRVGVRLRVLPETHVAVSASERVLAPGASEFLPPATGGPWVPPERTFSPLVPGSSFRVEHVRDVQAGIEQRLGRSPDGPTLALRRFRQSSDNQIATLYGLNADRSVGHYFVATPGSVTADGWIVGLSAPIVPRLTGSVEYTTARGEWVPDAETAVLATLVPSVVRTGRERVHDVTGSLNAVIPETSTRVVVAYRVAALSPLEPARPRSSVGRFDLEIRQALPIRLPRSTRTDLVIVVRNLSRDAADRVSLYDELLTVSPPMRVMGGVQVKF
jgi:outer membrane receptor protein involved in Fe transport